MKKFFDVTEIKRIHVNEKDYGASVLGCVWDSGEFFNAAKNTMEWYLCSANEEETTEDPNYETLAKVLKGAYGQAASGKGRERHANDRKFDDQPIMQIAKDHGLGFLSGQAEKKLKEAHTLLKIKGKDAAIRELQGAIIYTAAMILSIENSDKGECK